MQRISHGRGPNHQRNNTKDKGGLWLWMPHSYDIHHVPIQPPKSSIKSTRPTMFNNQGGGDGSVYRTTGNRARAFTVRSNGIEYSGAMCFPPSSDAKPYYSELEAFKSLSSSPKCLSSVQSHHTHTHTHSPPHLNWEWPASEQASERAATLGHHNSSDGGNGNKIYLCSHIAPNIALTRIWTTDLFITNEVL